jgi:hypothetical protein
VVALVVVLILIAVPLYLWRRPDAETVAPPPEPSASSTAAATTGAPAGAEDANIRDDRVRLGDVQRVKCSASRATSGQEGALCDVLPYFEKALARAIVESLDCAPRTGKAGSVNYVLDVDFTARRINVYPGASGEWKGPQARRAAACVERGLPPPQWDDIQHQYRFYRLAIMASYAAPKPTGTPLFE